jgi:hypothetical protein
MKQTAVEWLACEIGGLDTGVSYHYFAKKVEEAKEMERQQKRKDFTDGYMHGDKPLNHDVIDKWYNETYGGNK